MLVAVSFATQEAATQAHLDELTTLYDGTPQSVGSEIPVTARDDLVLEHDLESVLALLYRDAHLLPFLSRMLPHVKHQKTRCDPVVWRRIASLLRSTSCISAHFHKDMARFCPVSALSDASDQVHLPVQRSQCAEETARGKSMLSCLLRS